ncbi:hypothetical protein J6590_084248 [Homalodisca vitripennis]|nr:hypothetical protein J6590_084248 [Homalodisca vitripennis]
MVDPGTGTKSLASPKLKAQTANLTVGSTGTGWPRPDAGTAGRVMLVLQLSDAQSCATKRALWLQTLPAREMLVTPLQHSATHSPQPLM